ncbi:MAG: hypothetical protein ABFD46_12905 [Armatimonadota bacterium]
MRTFFLVLFILILAIPAWSAVRIGVLPVIVAQSVETEFASDDLRASLQTAIISDLQKTKLGEAVLLEWPEFMDAEQRPNFETLVGLAREQGCTGVLLVQIRSIRYEVKEKNIPLLGAVEVGEAEVILSGGLIDVATATGVAPVKATAKETQRPNRGPEPGDIVGRPLDDAQLRGSVLGNAFDAALAQVVEAVKTGTPRLSTQAAERPVRSNAPKGIGFAQDVFTFSSLTGYDRRGVVAVINRGDTPQKFILRPIAQLPDVTAGFVGEGSIDEACTLGPGQWKYVRFILNTPNKPLKDAELKLGLFVENGEQPDDTAIMRMTTRYPDARLSLEVVRQDPATLAYTCRLKNSGAPVWHIGVQTEDAEQKNMVRFIPDVSQDVFIPENGAVEFTVAPRLWFGMPKTDVRIEVSGMPDANPQGITLHFEVPAGKQVYYGLANTSSDSGSFAGWCVNQGGTHSTDSNGQQYCTGLGHSWSDASFSDNMGYMFGKIWAGVTGIFSSPIDPQPDHIAVTGYRGAVIRPAVLNRLPELATQDTLYPTVITSGGNMGIVTFVPSPDGDPTVIFGAYPMSVDDNLTADLSQLNEKGHAATWPFARFDANGRAIIAWVDAASGRKSNAALRSSTDDSMMNWTPITYLTDHSKGVDDPVILTSAEGYIAAAWEDLRNGDSRIYLRISRDGGKTFEPEVALPAQPGETQRWPQLAAMKGGFGVAYASQLAGKSRIQFRSLNHNAVSTGEPITLSNSDKACGEPQITTGKDGSLHVVWREGEDAASEVWHTAITNMTAKTAQRLTNDSAYSEYPAIVCYGDTLVVTYHSDISGVTDLMYRITSADNGQTWSSPMTLPSSQSVIEKAWLEVTFHLENSREDYPPFSAHFLVNGTEIGVTKDTVLEGVYLFPVPTNIVRGAMGRLAGNTVDVKIDDSMQGHFIYSSEQRLIAKWAYSQLPVVAASQEEADGIAKGAGTERNHKKPDLVLAANTMPKLPAELKAGEKLPLIFQVHNIGEASATDVVLDLYDGENLDLMEKPKPFASQKLGTMDPGKSVEAKFAFKFDPQRTPRVHAVLHAKEEDFHPADNAWAVSFTLGEAGTLPPTVGTDTPNVFYTPDLLDAVNIPDISKLTNLVNLPGFADMLELPELPTLPRLEIPNLKDFTSRLQNSFESLKPDIPDVPKLRDLLD